jgi:polar amino acid transport system substrate-binding protein
MGSMSIRCHRRHGLDTGWWPSASRCGASGPSRREPRSICRSLGLTWRLIKYSGDDFNGIFDGLAGGSYDAVISGTTITPECERVALFSAPYLEFNQGLAVNAARTPDIKSIDDLRGHIVGIQTGNTSDIVARKLATEGAIKAIKYYPYHGITDALDDLSAGKIGALIKLSPCSPGW